MTPLELLQAGFRIFPLHPGSKRPAVQGFHAKDSTLQADAGQIEAWLRANPEYGWGIATGQGLLVLDVDVKHGVNGFDSLDEAVPTWRDDLQTFTVASPSEDGYGRHYYFRANVGTIGAGLLPGVDYRANGGYVVAPGTVLIPEGEYWIENSAPIAPAPVWLGMLIGQAASGARHRPPKAVDPNAEPDTAEAVLKRVTMLVTNVASAAPGTGNSVLAAQAFMAGQYVGAGQLDREAVREMFVNAFDSWSFHDADHERTTYATLDRQLDAGIAEPRAWTKSNTEATVADKAAVKAMAERLRAKTPATGPLVIPGPEEMLTATQAMALAWRTDYGYALHAEQGDLFEWWDSRSYWRRLSPTDAANRVLTVLGRCRYRTRQGDRPWPTSPAKVKDVISTLGTSVLYRDLTVDELPVPAYSAVYCRNGRVDIATGELAKPDPTLFNKSALPFDYDPSAQCPRWLAFLDEALPADSIGTLQEWFGYVVSGRKDLQKILCLIGKPRAGKGTVTTVLEQLVGPDFTVAPDVVTFTGDFGRASMIGKSLAVFNEVNWGAARNSNAVSLLKSISGNDTQTVNRKNQDEWVGKLDVRIMIVSNDQPQFRDPSGAMAKRLIVLKFDNSAEGRENSNLGLWLKAELAGILNWALEGARRLEARGRFELPESAIRAKHEAEAQSSITAQFLEEFGVFDPTLSVDARELRAGLNAWQTRDGAGRGDLPLQTMLRELEAMGGVKLERRKSNGVRIVTVHGVGPAFPGAFSDNASGRF